MRFPVQCTSPYYFLAFPCTPHISLIPPTPPPPPPTRPPPHRSRSIGWLGRNESSCRSGMRTAFTLKCCSSRIVRRKNSMSSSFSHTNARMSLLLTCISMNFACRESRMLIWQQHALVGGVRTPSRLRNSRFSKAIRG